MAKFKDDEFSVIKSDIERLRKKTTMYISNKGAKGALHLCREAINNAIDEALSDKSPCDRIEITLDSNYNRVTVIDNGRGIPFDIVETITTYLHSGSNIDKANEKDNAAEVAGENGVGSTSLRALSSEFYYVIRREGKIGTFRFDDEKMLEPEFRKGKETEHGTAVVFIPSEEYLGKCTIDPKALFEWINMVSYTVPPRVKITFNHIKKGKEVPVVKEIQHKKGIEDLITEMVPKRLCKIIHLAQDKNRYKDKKTHTDVIYTIGEGDISDAKNITSFCNRVITIDHGTHVDAAKYAWCKAILSMAPEYMSENEKKNLKLTFEDARVGLSMVVVMNTPVPGFTGQTKQKVDNDDLYGPIVSNLIKDLTDYFRKNPSETKNIVGLIKASAKDRQSASKVRKSDYKPLDNFEEITSKVYDKCSSNEYRELWIMEGDSAKGGFTGCRDAKFQAAFKMKGNPKNVYGCTLAEVLANEELKVFTRILGCGAGKDFRLKNLKFDKIILLLDSDIDAYNMVSLLSAYFLWVLPEVVKAGKLYRAMAPFYIMKDPKHKYLITKTEYYELFADAVSKKMHLIDESGYEMTNKEMKKVITLNKDYLDELEPLVKYYSTNNEILEFCILYGEEKDFTKKLKKKFKELVYDEESKTISGSYKLAYQYLELSHSFFERTGRLAHIIKDLNGGNIYFRLNDDGNLHDEVVSMGTFFMMNRKYLPKIVKRIKGIGELPPEVLWETTLNPQNRELTRLTISDLEQELDTVKMLHGPDANDRREFMSGYVFNKNDIDT